MRIRFIILSLIFLCIACSDSNKNNGGLQTPESCDSYRYNVTSGTINFSSLSPNYVSPDASGAEDFVFKAIPLDMNFIEVNEPLQSIHYEIYNSDGGLIKESSKIDERQTSIYYLWDLMENDEPYYGPFSYIIELDFNSGTITGEGTAFAVACELIENCCAEDNISSDCAMFLDGDNCIWASSIPFGNQQSAFAVSCCQ